MTTQVYFMVTAQAEGLMNELNAGTQFKASLIRPATIEVTHEENEMLLLRLIVKAYRAGLAVGAKASFML